MEGNLKKKKSRGKKENVNQHMEVEEKEKGVLLNSRKDKTYHKTSQDISAPSQNELDILLTISQ